MERTTVCAAILVAVLSVLPQTAPCAEMNARAILDAAEVKGGLVVHLGCGGPMAGQLTAQLRASSATTVHGLAAAPADVRRAREHIRALGLRASVSVQQWDVPYLPYTDNLVNLLVVSGKTDIPRAELQRVLVPRGVLIQLSPEPGGGESTLGIRHSTFVKPVPDGLDDWTHFLHGADGNQVSDDTVAGPPRHTQWVCGPRWSKHHEKYPPTVPILVSAKGRVFYVEDETPACVFNVRTSWHLKARDAFNGTLLWDRPLPDWPPDSWPGNLGGWGGQHIDYQRRLVAAGDLVYVATATNGPVSILDAATGEPLRTIGPASAYTEILHSDGVLYVARRTEDGKPVATAYDAAGEKELWSVPAGSRLVVDSGRLFFSGPKESVVALDAATGKELWRAEPLAGKKKLRLQGSMIAGGGVLLVSPGSKEGVMALDAEDGRILWTKKNQGFRPWWRPVDARIIDGLVWIMQMGDAKAKDVADWYAYVGLDPKTGDVRKTVPAGQAWNSGHHQRCYPSRGTPNYMVFSRRGADFLNLDTGEVTLNNWTRGTCTYGQMFANGLTYSPPHACRCYSEAALRGLNVFASEHMPRPAIDKPRLEEGEAFGAEIADTPASGWPTYRHDAARSGATDAIVPTEIATIWETPLGGTLSAPTIADGVVFASSFDQHTVHALSLSTGVPIWEFTAGARVDSPPTISHGRVLFGCRDGYAYCLRVTDGALVWRFRAAPEVRLVGAWGQLESAWPVHGSVLVRDGVAYFAAGRNSYIDGGLSVFGVDVISGVQRYHHQLHGPFADAGMTWENPNRGFTDPGSTNDVLVAAGDRIFMRHMAFDPTLEEVTDMNVNYWPTERNQGEEFGGDHKFWCDIKEAPRLALRSDPAWYYRSYFYQWPGQRLYSTVGLLDDSWHIRSYWSYGQVAGQQIVFRGNRGFAVKAYPNAARWLFHNAGQGYDLYAGRTAQPQGDTKIFALRPEEFDWSTKVTIRPQTMLLAANTLFLSGVPDLPDPADALASLNGEKGARIWAVSITDGAKLTELAIPAPPVHDGLAAAEGRLVLTTADGYVRCFGGQ